MPALSYPASFDTIHSPFIKDEPDIIDIDIPSKHNIHLHSNQSPTSHIAIPPPAMEHSIYSQYPNQHELEWNNYNGYQQYDHAHLASPDNAPVFDLHGTNASIPWNQWTELEHDRDDLDLTDMPRTPEDNYSPRLGIFHSIVEEDEAGFAFPEHQVIAFPSQPIDLTCLTTLCVCVDVGPSTAE
jgi:hypothetical protein